MTPTDPRHGTRRGYYAHRRDNETACDACKRGAAAAEARYDYNRSKGVVSRISPLGTQRRLQALVAKGYTWTYLDRWMGNRMAEKFGSGRLQYVFPATYIKVVELYEALADQEPPQRNARERGAYTKAIRLAERNGWLPPIWWENPDDPNEQPDTHQRTTYRIDELVAEWEHFRRSGFSIHYAAEALGVTVKAIEKACERANQTGRAAS